jgi:hypothetical protein
MNILAECEGPIKSAEAFLCEIGAHEILPLPAARQAGAHGAPLPFFSHLQFLRNHCLLCVKPLSKIQANRHN